MNRLIFAGMLIALLGAAFPAAALESSDPDRGEQWYLDTVHAPAAWDVTQGSRDVIVAVLDTGIDLDHPDLVDNVWVNTDEVAGDGIDNDHNGYVDDVNGWDFVEGDNTPTPTPDEPFSEDGVAHGTAIAGVIGAVGDNSEGISGLNWKVKLMPLRILDNFGAGTSADAKRAIRYAVANGADIINLSFTGFDYDSSFESAVEDAFEAGVVVVAAVGNQDGGGVDLDQTPIYPACFKGADGTDWVIGVAASTEEDTKSDFSNYGSDCTDISAPGQDIFSTMYENDDWAAFNDYYLGGWAGTSIASPMVSGSVALMKAAYPSLTPTQVLTALQLSVDPSEEQGTDAAGKVGAGRLNVANAITIAGQLLATAAAEPLTDEELGITRDAHGNRIAPLSNDTGPSPVDGTTQNISNVQPGWFVRSAGYDTVYFVDAQLARHPVWDTQTYFTWNDTWDAVVWVTDATLPTMPIAPPIAPKPGVVLVKIQSDPSVYAVADGPTEWQPVLRKILTETVAEQMYGASWADFVLDVEPTLFVHYTKGADISVAEPVDTSILRSREDIQALAAGSGG